MKAILTIKFCVALLLTIITDGEGTDEDLFEITDILDKMAEEGRDIDGIFKPSINGSLGIGDFGSVYRGKLLLCDNMEVAMKFMSPGDVDNCDLEYRMYTYLGAIHDPEIETHGIPSIYFFGVWEEYDYSMLAMTILDCEFKRKLQAQNVNELDLLNLFREFVRTIKYVHSHGIIHDNSEIENMAIHNGRCFIYDFVHCEDMAEGNRIKNIQMAKGDFQLFLYSVFSLFQQKLPESSWRWLGLSKREDAHLRSDWRIFSDELARTNGGYNSNGLRRVYAEFAKHAVDIHSTSVMDKNGNLIPFYDQLYRVVDEEMKNYGEEATSSNPSIYDIRDPFATENWNRSAVNFELFEEKYAEQIKRSNRME